MTATRATAPRDRKVDGDSGFSLVETMVSVTLLAIVAAGATTAVVAGSEASGDNLQRSTATNLARADLDQARAIPYPAYPVTLPVNVVKLEGYAYRVTRTVTAAGTNPSASCPAEVTATGVRSLVVTSRVTWIGSPPAGVTMSTVVAC